LQGFFRFSLDGRSGFLVVNTAVDDDGQRTTTVGATATEDRCVRYVREALGAPDLPVQIEDVQRWNAAAEWAEHMRSGPVLLAGDAAHVMPPTGGYGGNTGVHDAHNLAWKLAQVLAGHAGDELLSTYEQERLPVARLTVEQAYTRYVTRLDPGLGTDGLEPLIDDAAIDLGYRYRSSSITPDGPDDGADWEDPREPTGRPGIRAPHVPLRLDGTQLSTLDLVRTDMVLLVGPDGAAWQQAGKAVAQQLGVPLDLHVVGDGDFLRAYGIEPGGAVLVRPDAVVAWRAVSTVDDAPGVMNAALARAFGR